MSKKLRILNTTMAISPPRGFALDLEGKYIGPGREITIELPVIPVILEEWTRKGWARFQDADDKTPISTPGEAAVTPGTVVNEAKPSDFEEEEFDLALAKEASLPHEATPAPIEQSNAQMQGAKVSFSMGEATTDADHLSPIPGDKPRSVDESDKFSIRAPRADAVGAVIKS